ncbi:GNAT family N-acetyltransferase [Pseudomonas sp. SED1]|uniref:GNAT family N-acetyltransferase n=1 Tax=Pseudomonas sp. SED1 TaxID=3056845 RepID=UPI00296EAB6E|nr:GNAT family N-acetyltransferase [Pseudomonas sp. SED1]MDY0835430.1 GNAT family N-acetyltransferase [Pseudomonas sp. SED1]
MFEIKRYDSALVSDWNFVVENSKNGNFLHLTNYFKYHEDRFHDASLIVYKKNKPVAVFPSNKVDGVVYSHSGLSYAGLIYGKELSCKSVLDIFESIIEHYRVSSVVKIIYKCIPDVFSRYPSGEDLYALFRHNATLIRRDVSSVIELSAVPKLSDSRKCVIRKAEKNDVTFCSGVDVEAFYGLLTSVLAKFSVVPVHTLAELNTLIDRFPSNIKVFGAVKDGELLSGALVYDFGHIVHTQYLGASDEGRKVGALDFVLNELVSKVYSNKKYFSFGISTENGGRYLNEGLIAQKEGFGARAVVHDFYEIKI